MTKTLRNGRRGCAGNRRIIGVNRQTAERALASPLWLGAIPLYQPRVAHQRGRLPAAGADVRRSATCHPAIARAHGRRWRIEGFNPNQVGTASQRRYGAGPRMAWASAIRSACSTTASSIADNATSRCRKSPV